MALSRRAGCPRPGRGASPAAARQQFSRRRRRHAPRTPQRAHSPPPKAAKSTRPPWAKISRPRIGAYLASCVKAAGMAERSRVPAEGGGRYPSDKTKSTDFKSMLSFFGAADEARTRYLHLGKVALYQMSYSRIFNLQVAFLFYPCRGHVALTRFDDSKVSCLPLRRYHSGRNRFRCGATIKYFGGCRPTGKATAVETIH